MISLINHFIACCRESKKHVLTMECESQDEEHLAVIAVEEHLNSVTSAGNRNQVFATLTADGKEEKFQLDSGSTVNMMAGEKIGWRGRTVSNASVSLVMGNEKLKLWARNVSRY